MTPLNRAILLGVAQAVTALLFAAGFLILLLICLLASAEAAQADRPARPRLARSLSPERTAAIATNAPPGRRVSVPRAIDLAAATNWPASQQRKEPHHAH
jgi:hypothetical protein